MCERICNKYGYQEPRLLNESFLLGIRDVCEYRQSGNEQARHGDPGVLVGLFSSYMSMDQF